MHKVINNIESTHQINKHAENQQTANAGDKAMFTEQEQLRETKIKQLLQRVDQLPKSFQLTLRGELQFLNDAKKSTRVIGEEMNTEVD